jgi:proline iminopeptidase
VPLLTLHGGPGAGHDNLEPLEALASYRPVVFYDQLGCGKSGMPDDVSLWQIERFAEEVAAVRKGLNLERVHVYGQSWGGWLAIDYMMRKPSGVVSLILGSAAASTRQFVEELALLRAFLPQEVQDTLRRYEAAGDYRNPEYESAAYAFLGPLFCRLASWPEVLGRTMEIFNRNRVSYETMWGPNDMVVTGNLKDWDRSDRLGEIAVPTLIFCGRYDEVTPACSETLHRGIPNSEMHVLEQSAHMAHLEEAERYIQIMREFLDRAEQKPTACGSIRL